MLEFQTWLVDHAVRIGIMALLIAAVLALLFWPVRKPRRSNRHRVFRPRTRTLMILVSRRQRKLTYRPGPEN